MPHSAAIARVAGMLRDSRRVLFITGAGMSADSGLPTYRGIGGLYNQGVTEEGIPIEVALSGQMLQAQPAVCWKYIAQIEQACRGAKHNRGHEIIAEIETALEHVCVLTQNVDGFHRDAGSQNVIEIHGDVHDLTCTQCNWTDRVTNYAQLDMPPACPSCGGLVRPVVVLFGEMLPNQGIAKLRGELMRGFDLVVSIGTTSVFPYIAGPVVEARRGGRPTVEINPGQTEVSEVVDIKIPAGAKDTLEAIWTAYRAG